MSDEVDRWHGIEKAAMENVLNRSHVLAANIANELRNKRPEHFVDKLSLADFYALSLSETYALKYWPPRTGIASVRPTVWTARGIGASLCSDRCVRASL